MSFARKPKFNWKTSRQSPALPSLLWIILSFATISFLMLYSAANAGLHPWALKQSFIFSVFVIVMLLLSLTKLQTIFHFSYYAYGLCIILLIVAELKGYTTMGAQRWLRVGNFNFQPSELAKVGVILALSRYFHHSLYPDLQNPLFLIIPIIIIILPTTLILNQPNLGTSIILILISLSICFISGLNRWFMITPGLVTLGAMPVIWNFLHDYQKKRIFTFLNPEQDLLGAGYNITQSKIAIGAGGFWGKGFMLGTQNQLSFLPEKHTDFIFTLLAEEWGFLGSISIMMLYIALLGLCYGVAFKSQNCFGRCLSIGVATMIFLHVFVNLGMISGLLPIVGTPLSLLSYGGSNLATVLIGLGLVLAVDRNQDRDFRTTRL